MTNVYTDLFRCLCRDLELCLLRIPTIEERGELRKQLLSVFEMRHNTAVHLCRRDAAYGEWLRQLSAFIECPTDEPFGSSQVHFIRRVYVVLCFELRKPTETTTEKENAYVDKFLKTEQETQAWRCPNSWVSRCARILVRIATSRLDLSPANIARHGRHGPGSVLNGEVAEDKNCFQLPPHDLQCSYPYDTFFANASMWSEHCSDHIGDVYEDRHVECRLVLAPKDYRGPRGVFVSSKEAMFCQLGQAEALVSAVSSSWIRHCYDPADQLPSQAAALTGIINEWQCCTLDLADASDRIPLSLVAYLFHRHDYVALARTRSSYVWIGDKKHRLHMFSPMGDGKTFQVLSIVCAALTTAAILVADGWTPHQRLSLMTIIGAARKVRVFGDDIIVDSRYYSAVVEALEAHNLRVNRQKSFKEGVFREACGEESLFGFSIRPVRNSRFLNLEELDTESLPRICGLHRNLCQHLGELSRTALYVEALCRRRFGQVPYTDRYDGLGLFSVNPEVRYRAGGYLQRFNPHLQKCEWRVRWLTRVQYPECSDSWWNLNYSLLPKGRSLCQLPAYSCFRVSETTGCPSEYWLARRLIRQDKKFRLLCTRLNIKPDVKHPSIGWTFV